MHVYFKKHWQGKKQLADTRKTLPPEIRKRSFIKHLPSWPYLELRRPNPDNPNAGSIAVPHSFTKEAVALAALNFDAKSLDFTIPKVASAPTQ